MLFKKISLSDHNLVIIIIIQKKERFSFHCYQTKS